MTFPRAKEPPSLLGDIPIREITDHRERALSRLLGQYQGKPRFETLVGIYARPLQELESVFWALRTQRWLSSAQGAQLDVLGRILLEPRGGLGDIDYLRILRVKILVLRSSGTGDDLIRITQGLLQSSAFQLTEHSPAACLLTIPGTVTEESRVWGMLHKAKAAGVRLDIIRTGPGGNGLTYASAVTGGGNGGYGSAVSGGGNGCYGVI